MCLYCYNRSAVVCICFEEIKYLLFLYEPFIKKTTLSFIFRIPVKIFLLVKKKKKRHSFNKFLQINITQHFYLKNVTAQKTLYNCYLFDTFKAKNCFAVCICEGLASKIKGSLYCFYCSEPTKNTLNSIFQKLNQLKNSNKSEFDCKFAHTILTQKFKIKLIICKVFNYIRNHFSTNFESIRALFLKLCGSQNGNHEFLKQSMKSTEKICIKMNLMYNLTGYTIKAAILYF